MTIVSVKIHPALGIARVGNSPDQFFIGPERPWDRSIPDGGYKDNQCRVKRQAARFRIFAYHNDRTVTEVTEEEASISWTVHLANKKASVKRMSSGTDRNPKLNPGDPPIDPKDLIIDPGPRLLSGPNERQVFDTGQIKLPGSPYVSVLLGEARTDELGHLLILGGFGQSKSPTNPPRTITSFYDNAGWYDDVSDGKVSATIHIRETGETFVADGAWVVVAPPKFAPGIDNVITLYDRLYDMAVKEKWVNEPTTTSYTQDIYPILERARTTQWVQKVLGSHTWPDPVIDATTRFLIFSRLFADGEKMPFLVLAELTTTQLKHMERWKDGSFIKDWASPPLASSTITPEGLDKAALENAVGAAFNPGIEVGGITECPIDRPSNYVAPFRLNHKLLEPGDLTAFMSLPWQADFLSCGSGSDGSGSPISRSWWPVPRPIDVLPYGKVAYQAWRRDVGYWRDMVENWHTLGFVVKQDDQRYVEVDRCPGSFVKLITPNLNFEDISVGAMGTSRTVALPIIFEVKSTVDKVTLEFQSGPKNPRLMRLDRSVTVDPTIGDSIATAKLWIKYETGYVGEVLNDRAVIRNPANDQTWDVHITANTVGRVTVVTAVVLDRSAIMSVSRRDIQSKHKSLQEAVSIFVDTMLEGDGIAAISYNEDSQLLQDVTLMGSPDDPFDTARLSIKNMLAGQQQQQQLKPSGATSVGAGISEALRVLNAAESSYGKKALIILTDGKENREPWIADVEGNINLQTYSIILGIPQNSSTPALQAVSRNSGGDSLITGDANGDKRFMLTKYLLQIFANITNAEVVIDSHGDLVPGVEHRIPFIMTEADNAMDVILLSPSTQYVDFRLQTPIGFIVEPGQSGVQLLHVLSKNVSYYRIALPMELSPNRLDKAGTWHVLLKIGQPHRAPGTELRCSTMENKASVEAVERKTKLSQGSTVHYSLLVHAYSSLTFRASLQQSNYEPGATMSLYANISESGIPLQTGATSVWVEVTRPDDSGRTLSLRERDDGQFSVTFHSTIPGIYRLRIRASGRSRMGYPFQREQTLTGAVWHGGNHDRDLSKTKTITRLMREQD